MKALPMRLATLPTLALLAIAFAPSVRAQSPSTPAPEPPAATANPVVWSANEIYARQAKFILAAAALMPADKYTYTPSAAQWTFAKILSHVAASNGSICASLSGKPAPDATKAPETAPKPDLLAAVQASITFCDAAMASLTDAQLADPINFRRSTLPRARALIEIVADLEDHYSQLAAYLRANSILPPSASPKN
jgi:uncharacterized damage-inducible protein DinB